MVHRGHTVGAGDHAYRECAVKHPGLVLAAATGVIFAMSGSASPGALSSAPSGSAAAAARPHCFGKVATIVGTKGADVIHGTPGADVIAGNGGRDRIFGRGGADLICDRNPLYARLHGGSGDDRILASGAMAGGPGNDLLTSPRRVSYPTFRGGSGDDVLRSRAGFAAFFFPGPGDDVIKGRPGAKFNILELKHARRGSVVDLRSGTADGPGHDTLSGVNTVYGSKFNDVLRGDGRSNVLFGRAGNDVIVGRGGVDAALGGPGDDGLNGGPGGDNLRGDAGSDVLLGRSGNDTLIEVGPDANLVLAGPGRDRCYGSYRVPPSVERSCELHKPAPLGTFSPLSRSSLLRLYRSTR
jgi:Ca2+-binding RTX toxin-like protein